jgi:electron transfer flavoprotein beta subunit
MNIIVSLQPVRHPASFTVNRKAQKIFIHREEFVLNPADKNALEAALRLGGQVTAISIGETPADEAVRLARAMGASRAIRVNDPALVCADASAYVMVFQRLITHLGGAELVMLGAQTLASDLAQVGPRLAQALDWPFLPEVHHMTLAGRTLKAVIPRQGVFHNIEADLPAVVSVARDSNQPRYAHGREILNLFKDQSAVEVLSLADLQLAEADVAPRVEVRGQSFPTERELGRRLEGTPEAMARQVVEVIRKI